MLKGFGLDAFLSKVAKRNKLTYDLLDYVVLMLSERLHEPRY